VYRERFNLAAHQGHVLGDEALVAPAAPVGPGGLFAVAWRNYIRAVFKKGYMYKVSCKPSVILYIAENKTLAGKEDRSYEGEALGRKMAVVFFEDMPGPGNLVRRMQRETMGMQQVLLSVAEVLQTLGMHGIPADPDRTAAQMEQLLEGQYEHLDLTRFKCSEEPAAPEAHVFSLSEEQHAETALALEVPAGDRTKMILARSLQRHDELGPEETLQAAWGESLVTLRARSGHLFPVPVAPAAPPARGRGRGRGDGVAAAATAAPAGRGRGRGAPAAPAPAPAPGRGRGKGRARGRGRG